MNYTSRLSLKHYYPITLDKKPSIENNLMLAFTSFKKEIETRLERMWIDDDVWIGDEEDDKTVHMDISNGISYNNGISFNNGFSYNKEGCIKSNIEDDYNNDENDEKDSDYEGVISITT